MKTEGNGVVVWSLFACLVAGPGCGGDDDNDDATTAGHSGANRSGSGGMSAAGGSAARGGDGTAARGGAGAGGSMTAGGTSGGQAGDSGGSTGKEQTPPPEMPRELGPADGVYCESAFSRPPPETCAVGSRCCPNGLGGRREQVCMPDGAACPPCNVVECGQLLCDGPEDCSGGEFCCYAQRGFCRNNPGACMPENPDDEDSSWMSVECRARCVGDQRDPDHGAVVCEDDRDCPGPFVAGRCRPLDAGEIPYGLKVCSG